MKVSPADIFKSKDQSVEYKTVLTGLRRSSGLVLKKKQNKKNITILIYKLCRLQIQFEREKRYHILFAVHVKTAVQKMLVATKSTITSTRQALMIFTSSLANSNIYFRNHTQKLNC